MTERDLVDYVAEAIWGREANKRLVTWSQMNENVKDLWRIDARRAVDAMRAHGECVDKEGK